jgi:hypothetical protein
MTKHRDQITYAALAKRLLTDLALRTLTTPTSPEEHVREARAYLASVDDGAAFDAGALAARMTPAQIRAMREILSDVLARGAAGLTPGLDTPNPAPGTTD